MADLDFSDPFAVSQARCQNFSESSRLEWLQTNHTGAFAMGTVAGVNTRRYHGLLIASLNPPADRYSILPRVEETIVDGEKSFALATVQYPGEVSPAGYKLLEGFSSSPHPVWRYRCGELTVYKTLRLLEGEQSVRISYSASSPCQINIRLFVSFRDYHSLSHRNSSLIPRIDEQTNRLVIRPYADLPPLTVHHNALHFEPDGAWYENNEYLLELDRGLDFREDLYSPGVLHFILAPAVEIYLLATLETAVSLDQPSPLNATDPLVLALDQFRVTRTDKKPTLIAGYPWFTDWSRDTLMSLPALMVAGFPPGETKSILEFLLAERKQGILPNRFTDRSSTPEYNTADASLWMFVAAHEYVAATNDIAFVRSTLFPAAIDIIRWHIQGTFYGIQVDPSDHLLRAGADGTQLTWMDARVGDHVVTPRVGKPVEVNALWFNALKITGHWADQIRQPDDSQALASQASQVQTSFNQSFWNSRRGCLYDVLTPSGPDSSVRPNQLLALSLPYPLLDCEKAQSIVRLVQQELLTKAGLRTLEPSDPRYRGRFQGDMRSRDSVYHQGTVWPWSFGPYVNAYLYAFNRTQKAKRHCREIIEAWLKLMSSYCLGSIGEVYDGDEPQRPGGCPAQLWSVAQLILSIRNLDSSA